MTIGYENLTAEETNAVIAQGHAPSAGGRLGVDFDGTLFPFGKLFDADLQPFSGAAEAVRNFKQRGYTIYIFTSRLSETWWTAEGKGVQFGRQNLDYVKAKLDEYGIPYDSIGAEKIPCEWYIDDRALNFNNNWQEIQERILHG